MLTLTNLGHNAGARALTLETLEGAFQRLVFLDAYFRHLFSLPSPISPWLSPFTRRMATVYILYRVCVNTSTHYFVFLYTKRDAMYQAMLSFIFVPPNTWKCRC